MRPFSRSVRVVVLTLAVGLVGGCGGDDDDSALPDPVDGPASPDEDGETSPPETDDTTGDITDDTVADEASFDGTDACSLLDETFLNETLEGQTSNFGDPFEFQAPLQTSPSATCSWKDATTALSMQLTVEATADAETDDHSGRAYNIDEEPTVEPQDGPGDKPVLLVDTAFSDLGSDGFPYGYFFVEGDDTVFIETVGLDVGAEALRAFADEAHRRLLAG